VTFTEEASLSKVVRASVAMIIFSLF
jgi:hypothetical protein